MKGWRAPADASCPIGHDRKRYFKAHVAAPDFLAERLAGTRRARTKSGRGGRRTSRLPSGRGRPSRFPAPWIILREVFATQPEAAPQSLAHQARQALLPTHLGLARDGHPLAQVGWAWRDATLLPLVGRRWR